MKTNTILATDIELTLRQMQNDKQREVYMRFFKTNKGEYGYGDIFLGVTNPKVRLVVREAWKQTSLNEATKLIMSKIHEVRLCGLLILTKKMEQAVKHHNDDEMRHIFELYISLHKHINNWDLVDLSATIIAGFWELHHPEEHRLDEWIEAPDSTLWQRRIAMVSTWRLMRYGRYDEVTKRAQKLISTPDDLLHKAAGWMLRELSKNGGTDILLTFLSQNVSAMPSVMLRYAIEKFSLSERQYWLSERKKAIANK